MTGTKTPQPLTHNDSALVLLFNGEIYKYKSLDPDAPSDSSIILPYYQKYGKKSARIFDGEFAIVIVDNLKHEIFLSTDVFGTKPIFVCLEDPRNFHAATYASALKSLGCQKPSMVPPNTSLVFKWVEDESGGRLYSLVEKFAVHEFDLRQFKMSTKDWEMAFLQAVEKRAANTKQPPFIGLSSGYDSGAIQAALVQLKIDHHAYSIYAREDESTLLARIEFARNFCDANIVVLSPTEFDKQYMFLYENAELFEYTIPGREGWMINDPAACGLSFIAEHVRENSRIYLSGSGADEIISDYGFNGTKIFEHSDFGGLFPENLHEIFPWTSFFLGTQRDYLMKEEMVAGAHGIEGRYPFLDKFVVQEYLWLNADVKNSLYKKPVYDFLRKSGYPIVEGKRGFDAADNLRQDTRIIDFPKTPKAHQRPVIDIVAEKASLESLAQSQNKAISILDAQLKESQWSAWHLNLWRLFDLRISAGKNSLLKPSKAAVENFIALTCVTDESAQSLGLPVFEIFKETAPFPITNVCSRKNEWKGMSSRLNALLNFLKGSSLSKDTLVLVSDGLDVFFSADDQWGFENLREKFLAFQKRVVMSTEPFCGWGGANECSLEEITRFPEVTEGENRFLNAGVYLGFIEDVIWLINSVLQKSESKEFSSDQRLFFEVFWSNKDRVSLDTQQLVFGNFISTHKEVCPNGWVPPCDRQPCCVYSDSLDRMHEIFSLFSFEGCQVKRRVDSTSEEFLAPLLWHGNGMGKMLFLAAVNKLAESCPWVARAIIKSQGPGMIEGILSAVNQAEPYQERTKSFTDAQSGVVA